MAKFTPIIRSLAADKFNEIIGASSRKSREIYFHRHGIDAPKMSSLFPRPGAKNAARATDLFARLQEVEDEELAEEIVRTWLLSKRPMLAAALDHLGIVHDNGLTESDDVKKFESLSVKEIRALVDKLSGVSAREDIAIYLRFMGTQKLDEALSK